MGTIVLFSIIAGVIIAVIWVGIDQARAKSVECPVCGKTFKLVNDSYKCPKCRTRIVRTKDGNVISTN